jgi:hypothetical protein
MDSSSHSSDSSTALLKTLLTALDAGLEMLADPAATQLDAEQVSTLFEYAISRLRGEVQ